MYDQLNDGKKLKRVLGFWSTFGVVVGFVISGTAMVSLGNMAGNAGYASFLTMAIALIPMMAAAFAFAELTSMLPGGGMVSEYTMPALGRLCAIFSILSGYVMLISADGGTQQVIAGLSMESLVGIPQPVTSALLLLFVLAINFFGVDFFGKIEAVLTMLMLIIFVFVGVIGLSGAGETMGGMEAIHPDFELGENGWSPVFMSVGTAIWLFIGFDFVCPMAEENINPHKNIPKALIIGLICIYIMDVIFAFASYRYTPTEILLNSSIPHVEAARHLLGNTGFVLMSVLTIVAAVTTANAHIAALSRMLYGMARERLAPRFFSKLHPKYRTPWCGILFTAGLMVITLVYVTAKGADVSTILTLVNMASITWMCTYIIAMVDVLVLRKKYPDFPRLWKAPFAKVTMPIGIIGVLYAIYTMKDTVPMALLALIVFVIYAIVWLKTHKIPMFKTVELDHLVEEVRQRSEELPEWDKAVEVWLEKQKAR